MDRARWHHGVVTERILVLHDRPDELAACLASRCADASVRFAASPEEVGPALVDFDPTTVLSIKHSAFPGSTHRPALRHPGVSWFHVGGSGYEHLGSWDPERVAVTNSAGVLAPFLAETALAALLSLAVGLPRYGGQQRRRQWRPGRFRAVAGRTLLVVGVGAVGGELADRASALGMRVLGVRESGRPHRSVERMVGPDALHAVLPLSDVVSLHVPLTPQTRGLIGARELALLPPQALLLNSARGPVVDGGALLAALQSGVLGGAWLDVTDPEPLPADSPLWEQPDLLITPHCADQVQDWPLRFAQRFCDLRDLRARGGALPVLSPG